MSNGLMYAQMGLKVVSAAGAFAADNHDAKMAKISRAYQEKMSAISAAMQTNVLTQNEISFRDASINAKQAIEMQSMKDRANAEVSAAASGTIGGSVKATMRGLTRSRLRALQAHENRVKQQAQTNDNNRRNVALAKVFNKDISVLPRPSVASSLLGLGASVIDIYDSHQPEGSKTADTISRLGTITD